MEIITKSEEETASLGRELADKLAGYKVVALWGDLGSGKTTFTRGLAKGLGIKKRITSPTFLLAKPYNTRPGIFWHVDLYRIEKKSDPLFPGFSEMLEGANAKIVIEWPKVAQSILPKKRIDVFFHRSGEGKRKIEIYFRH